MGGGRGVIDKTSLRVETVGKQKREGGRLARPTFACVEVERRSTMGGEGVVGEASPHAHSVGLACVPRGEQPIGPSDV
ncbi:hypothetical protein GW17_00050939 [Ensete ventricosum]|nr:hypothetical protein GW17_00050939 [Ensete ventricosum]